MNNGTAAGWDSLPLRAPADPPAGAVAPSEYAENQRAGLGAMLGLGQVIAPSRSDLVLDQVGASARVRADAAGIILRPAPVPDAARLTLQPLLAEFPEASNKEQNRFAHLPGLCLLVIILTVQAALSARFLRADTAFGDEALYIWAGHLEWAHWLHGTSIPAFPTWFSGSPIIYPPLAALADGWGGLVGARVLSLGFMLAATCLLWATTARLFGRQSGFFAAALFAVIGPTLHLGAFATYDAMALCLMALAAWCACGARQREDATGWMLACALALALANATKYASAIFDPIVVIIAILSARPQAGGKAALRRGALLVTCLTGTLAVLLRLGGSWYVTGISQTTTLRPAGQDPVPKVVAESWEWTAVVVVASLVGLALSIIRRDGRPVRYLVAALAGAALLVPIEQARIQTAVSLAKHLDFGAWFACIACGYALGSLVTLLRPRFVRVAAAVCLGAAIVPAAAAGASQARAMINWPASRRLIAFIKPLTRHGGRFLAETNDVPEYYLPATSWRQWSNTFSITLPDGRVHYVSGSAEPYAQAISRHYFTLVILSFSETPAVDAAITAALRATPGYRLIGVVPYGGAIQGNYAVWAYRPNPGSGGS